MKQIIGIFSLLALINCQSISTVETSKFKTIMIKSFGEVETLPNIATFNIDLNCLDKSIKISKKCLVDKSNELHSKLKSFGIIKDNILTTSVNMNKSYTWKNNSKVFEGYKISTTVFVIVRNIEKLDKIYTELLENRNLDLDGLNYSHSKLDSLKNVAYLNALEKSAILVDKLLEKIPESQKEILKIGNVEISASMPKSNESMPKMMLEKAVFSKNKSIAISKGTITVNATLYVEYQIK